MLRKQAAVGVLRGFGESRVFRRAVAAVLLPDVHAGAGSGAADDDVPNELLCPISMAPMSDPVVAADGFTYERAEIEHFLRSLQDDNTPLKSPMTGQPLGPHGHILFDNTNLRKLGADYAEAAKRRRVLPASPSRLIADGLLSREVTDENSLSV